MPADLTIAVDGTEIPVYLGENTEIAARLARSAPQVPCTIAGTNDLTLTPISPFEVVGIGENQTFFGRAAASNTGAMTIVIPGFNDGDPRQIRLPGGTDQVPSGAVKLGEVIAVAFLATGLFELLIPAVSASAVVSVEQSNESGNDWELDPLAGTPSLDSLFMFLVENEQGEGGILVEIAGLNDGDVRQLRMPNGVDQVDPGTFAAGDTVFFRMNLSTAHFDIVLIAQQAAAATGALSNYQKIELRRAVDRFAASF